MRKYRIAYIIDDGARARTTTGHLFEALGIVPRFISSGGALIARMNDLKPGCVVLDMDVSGIDTFAILEALAKRPAHLPVIVVSSNGDIATVVRVMQLGACDFILRPMNQRTLSVCLDRIFGRLAGDVEAYERRQRALARLTELTDREHDILHGLIAGLPNKLLAHDLGVSIRTVEMHRANLMQKLGVDNLAQALRVAFEAGLDAETPHHLRSHAA